MSDDTSTTDRPTTKATTVWRRAWDLLDTQGWTQVPNEDINDITGPICAGEAISIVLTGGKEAFYRDQEGRKPGNAVDSYLTEFADHVKAPNDPRVSGSPRPAVDRVYTWNDARTRLWQDVSTALLQLDRKERLAKAMKRERRAKLQAENPSRSFRLGYTEVPTPRMPDHIQPYNEGEGEAPDCQICGEPGDLEMGEFSLPEPDPQDGSLSVVAHAQCGLDHGLEIA